MLKEYEYQLYLVEQPDRGWLVMINDPIQGKEYACFTSSESAKECIRALEESQSDLLEACELGLFAAEALATTKSPPVTIGGDIAFIESVLRVSVLFVEAERARGRAMALRLVDHFEHMGNPAQCEIPVETGDGKYKVVVIKEGVQPEDCEAVQWLEKLISFLRGEREWGGTDAPWVCEAHPFMPFNEGYKFDCTCPGPGRPPYNYEEPKITTEL